MLNQVILADSKHWDVSQTVHITWFNSLRVTENVHTDSGSCDLVMVIPSLLINELKTVEASPSGKAVVRKLSDQILRSILHSVISAIDQI